MASRMPPFVAGTGMYCRRTEAFAKSKAFSLVTFFDAYQRKLPAPGGSGSFCFHAFFKPSVSLDFVERVTFFAGAKKVTKETPFYSRTACSPNGHPCHLRRTAHILCALGVFTICKKISVGYILKTPNFWRSIGALKEADNARPRTRRVSAGSITPSSQSRAVA
jgi:hypothetical protein